MPVLEGKRMTIMMAPLKPGAKKATPKDAPKDAPKEKAPKPEKSEDAD